MYGFGGRSMRVLSWRLCCHDNACEALTYKPWSCFGGLGLSGVQVIWLQHEDFRVRDSSGLNV